jgi:hypothetical protein
MGGLENRVAWGAAAVGVLGLLGLWLPACFGDDCFAEGTLLDTPSGAVAIESLAVGDVVYSYDFSRRVRVPARVARVFRHTGHTVRRLTLADGRSVRVTESHPFRADGAWRRVEDLAMGSELVVAAEEGVVPMPLAGLSEEEHGVTVYDLEVSGHHNFFAEGILVHNKSPLPEDRDGDGVDSSSDCDDLDPEVGAVCPPVVPPDAGPPCAFLGEFRCYRIEGSCCTRVPGEMCVDGEWTCPEGARLSRAECNAGCADASVDAGDAGDADDAGDAGDADGGDAVDAAADAAPDAPP